MWPKTKFGAQIFVTDVVSKFMGKITRRRQRGPKQGRKTIGFEALLRNGSKMPKRGHG